MDQLDAPHLWLTTLLAAFLKAGKSPLDPESYRLVGIESCLLKMGTLLTDRRSRQWADQYHILPESQNGFRPGYRTNNNVFILRCAIERARAEGKTFYVVFLGISNALLSTDLCPSGLSSTILWEHQARYLTGCEPCTHGWRTLFG